MSKRPSLAESMRQVVQGAIPPARAAAAQASPPIAAARGPAVPPDVEPAPMRGGFYAATRAGKKKVTAPLTPAAHKQLRQLALELDLTTESLMLEAIRDLFLKHGRPPIA